MNLLKSLKFFALKSHPRHRQKSTESLNFQLQQEKHQADALKEAVKKVIMMTMTVTVMKMTIMIMFMNKSDDDNSDDDVDGGLKYSLYLCCLICQVSL